MPKLSAMRWPIAIGLVLLLIAGVSLFWGSSHPSRGASPFAAISWFFTGDEYEGEIRELQLLQAALHRITAELRQQAPGFGLASLRTEREAVTRDMRSAMMSDALELSVNMDHWMTPCGELADYILPASDGLERPLLSNMWGFGDSFSAASASAASTIGL